MEAAWVVYADALTDASTAQTIATANAYSAAVGRWAGQEGGAYATMTAAIEAAKATLNVGWVALSKERYAFHENRFWVPLSVALGRQCLRTT